MSKKRDLIKQLDNRKKALEAYLTAIKKGRPAGKKAAPTGR